MKSDQPMVRKSRTPKPVEVPPVHEPTPTVEAVLTIPELAAPIVEALRPRIPTPKEVFQKPQKAMVTPSDQQRWFNLSARIHRLLMIWDTEDIGLRPFLLAALVEARNEVRREALAQGGYQAHYGSGLEMTKAKHLWALGVPWDKNAQCTKNTVLGHRCKNKPLIGQEHCQVVGHATEEERTSAWRITTGWYSEFARLLNVTGLTQAHNDLEKRIHEQH